jgi:monomeric sarcosine oxidase
MSVTPRTNARRASRRSAAVDVVVVGAGTFGAWTAHALHAAGQRVLLVDAHGPAHARASSGGESRLIRAGYGPDALYTRFSLRSLRAWKALARRSGEALFARTGVLWLAPARDPYLHATLRVLSQAGVPHEALAAGALQRRFPQMRVPRGHGAVLEPEAGVLLARRAVQTLVAELRAAGVGWHQALVVAPPPGKGGALEALRTSTGERLRARHFVFAAGPWLPRLFPDVVGERIRPTRQEVFFYGPPAGVDTYAPPHLPAWVDFQAGVYGAPDLEGRGVKLAFDAHGPEFDPEHGERVPTPEARDRMRRVLAERFPALADAPLLETRVCQYENTTHGDFLIDRHPGWSNVWIAGGGSGHGFKHGPAVGAYTAGLLSGRLRPEPRFQFARQAGVRERTVY